VKVNEKLSGRMCDLGAATDVQSGSVPQKLCNLVLALALIYNDCKNTTYAAHLLKNSKPAGEPEKMLCGVHGLGQTGTYSGL
jgi:hypothetical protein